MRRIRRVELKGVILTPSPLYSASAYHAVPHLPLGEGGDDLSGLKIAAWYGRIFEVDEPTGAKGTIIHIHSVPPADVFTADSK